MDLMVVIGFTFVLLLIGGFFVYFLKSTLNISDSSSIDPVPEEDSPADDKNDSV
jgi:hypothetical protein